eukprot:5142001-Prymnesium_polylepis.1
MVLKRAERGAIADLLLPQLARAWHVVGRATCRAQYCIRYRCKERVHCGRGAVVARATTALL